ncbi:TetR/AcrR family transcriptional regulator [Streptomyces sp. WAC05374]|uniref:TetR/AcrR family transcriptional regulator n=1 Tax=Streptomyces sp. WAC05374 TaxID=2487420 RepID=UPI000F8738CD|nr:TetR/AcrR family transcriptional regulator [Streptomyces sp. WAC05374]RST10274.1 TetR/AcrR family transcriptional regulator [Streptomyces sp. WAC05374]TDF50318.1 TetR/AcrR family transcriptional regulator [Streptomyces sp. WAC05374]TDF58042.1 TetR/AcrR family transcriptional regulator [Streptomyces sp. WAC05374]TDF60570.1 TetR/AcrR family transcriptional regulator [Streptomyces sp. WAC05374]
MTRERPAGARKRLTALDWADAALTAMAEGGGLAAVAVEPLAARLGTTKGSFYWHFTGRDALVAAALERWEEVHTERIIQAVEREPDPETRLRSLFRTVMGEAVDDPLEVSLLADAGHPGVAGVLRRVTDRRIGYVARLFEELGFPPAAAARRGLMAYTTYLGHTQLVHAVPDALPADPAYLESVLDALLRP